MNILGIIITGFGGGIFCFKNVWDKKIFKKIPWGAVGIFLLFLGLILSIISEANNNKSDEKTKEQTATIDSTTQNTYYLANTSFSDLKEANNALKKLIIEQSDSALKAKLKHINYKLNNLQDTLELQKEIAYRYYFSENWPISDKRYKVFDILYSFVVPNLWEILDGTDRYVVWKLIEYNGKLSSSRVDSLHNEIWNYLQPSKLAVGATLTKLNILGIVKADFWFDDLKFTDYYQKRLNVYNKYYKTNKKQFNKKISELNNIYWKEHYISIKKDE